MNIIYSSDDKFNKLILSIYQKNNIVALDICNELMHMYIADIKIHNLLYWLLIHNVDVYYFKYVLNIDSSHINSIDDISNENLLFYIAKHNLIEHANLCFEYNIYINQYSKSNDSALLWAIYNGHTEMSILLIEKGADIYHCYKDGKNAIMWAIYRNREIIFDYLLPYMKEIHKQDMNGQDMFQMSCNPNISNKIKHIINRHKLYLCVYFHQTTFSLMEYHILSVIFSFYSYL